MYATAVRPWAWVGPQQGASQPGRERERERESGRWRAGDRGEEPGSTVALRLAGQQANRLLVARSSGAVLLCAADTGQVLARYPACQGNHILGVAVTPDARSLCVLSGSERAVKVFELQTAALRTQIASQHSRFYGLAAAADNDTLCIGCDGAVELASISRGCVVAQLLGHTKSVNALMAVPGQLQLLSGSFDGTIRLWDLPSRRCTAVLRGHTSGTYSFALSADRRWLFSSGLDCTVRCWDLHTFQCVGVMANHERAVLALALTPMGDLLYSLDARVINVWRTKDLSCVGRLPHRGWRCMAISADGRYLYADGRPRDGWCPIDITPPCWSLATHRGHDVQFRLEVFWLFCANWVAGRAPPVRRSCRQAARQGTVRQPLSQFDLEEVLRLRSLLRRQKKQVRQNLLPPIVSSSGDNRLLRGAA